MRWCTKKLKIEPLEEFIGDDAAVSYVGIRADENRDGYISTKPNIEAVFPFREEGIDKAGVIRILEESGIGMPDYYRWRTRSGCFFCFFQRKIEWVRLSDEHPDLFALAVGYEEGHSDGRRYTWTAGETLRQLIARRAEIEREDVQRMSRASARPAPNAPLAEVLALHFDDDDVGAGCTICHV